MPKEYNVFLKSRIEPQEYVEIQDMPYDTLDKAVQKMKEIIKKLGKEYVFFSPYFAVLNLNNLENEDDIIAIEVKEREVGKWLNVIT